MADVGDLIAGRYRLLARVGSGGMGIVWQARDEALDRPVALKCAHEDDHVREAERLRTEARNAASLHHPHIVTVFDFFVEEDTCWVVMEYVPSRSLAQRIADDGPLTPEQAASVGWQIADALAVIHARGVVHGDVTPENILVTDDGVAKLSDFGISRAMWSDVTETGRGLVPGKPPYLAPEVARGNPTSRESDMFSLGASLFAATEGESPLGTAENAMTLVWRSGSGHIAAPQRSGRITPPLTALLGAEPASRPEAAQVRDQFRALAPPAPHIERLHENLAEHAVPLVPSAGGPGTRWRRTALTAVVAVCLAVAVGYPVYTTLHHTSGGHSGRDDKPDGASGKPATVGDARSADPCSLLDPGALGQFGHTALATDYGNFDRCDVLVETHDDDTTADLELDLEQGALDPSSSEGKLRKVHGLTVIDEPNERGECYRSIALADHHHVEIGGKQDGPNPPDLCALADAAVNHATAVLRRGPVPRRRAAPTKDSLARLHACDLLDTAALRAAKMDPGSRETTFGDWGCSWTSTTDGTDVDLDFDRNDPLSSKDGRPVTLGGRHAFVAAGGDGPHTCTLQTEYRSYRDAAGDRTVELLKFRVSGSGSDSSLCHTATTLGAAAARKLPKPAGEPAPER